MGKLLLCLFMIGFFTGHAQQGKTVKKNKE